MPDNSAIKSPALQLWFAGVGETTVQIEEAVQRHLSSSEQQRLQATNHANKRREYLLSRALMRHALNEFISHQHWQFVEQSGSPPLISNLPEGLHFSLTHSKGVICFALANCPVGLDLEKIREKRDFMGLAEAVMNEPEIEFLKQQPTKLTNNFYRLWCAKEACYKALPSQQQASLSLKNIAVMPMLERDGSETAALITQRNADFMLAIRLPKIMETIDYKHFPENDVTIAEFAQTFKAT